MEKSNSYHQPAFFLQIEPVTLQINDEKTNLDPAKLTCLKNTEISDGIAISVRRQMFRQSASVLRIRAESPVKILTVTGQLNDFLLSSINFKKITDV